MSEDDLSEKNIWEYKVIAKPKAKHQNSEPILMNVQETDYRKGKLQRGGNSKTSEEKESTKGSSQGTKHYKPNQPFCVDDDNPVMEAQEDVLSASAKQSGKKKTSEVRNACGKTKQGPREKTNLKSLEQPFNISNDHVAQSQEGTNQKNCKKQSLSKTRPVYEGYCPSCQMPFSLLLIQTPQWHVMECLDGPETAQKECPDGLLCTSTFASHYKRYSHFLLAARRAGECAADLSLLSIENNLNSSSVPPSISSGAFNFERLQGPSRHCLPIPKQSSLATDSYISACSSKNLAESSHRIQSIDTTKQVESSGHLFQKTESSKDLDNKLNTLITEADLSDCDISYSPLNTDTEDVIETEEVAAKMNNFPKTILDGSSLTDKRERSEGFNEPPSKVRDFNHNNVTTIKGCTTSCRYSESLNMLRNINQVSKPICQVKAAPTRVLKQMDIGVFFGLQPKAKMGSDQKKNPSEATQILSPLCAMEKKPRPRKRKAEGSVGDLDSTSESPSKNEDLASGGQKRWRKRFRESYPVEDVRRRKQCPFYKKIPGTEFVVDAFQYGEIEGCKGYFLTHFHSDHYGGLTKKFTFPIYCNQITGNLVKNKLQVQEQYIHILPMKKVCILNGIKVVMLDANHCPGAAMILFSLPNGVTILHTGDFRADPSMERCPFLIGRKVDTLYLDTTYCNPEYTFPSQQEVIQFAVNTAFERVTLHPRTLVICGTYSVGKEKIFLAIAEVLGSKVSMSQEKFKTLQCLESPAINSLITLEWNNTLLHLLPMMQINFKRLESHLNKFSKNFDQILAFKPTGWTYSDRCCSLTEIQPQTRGKITIYGIPYSEHSSFLEMKRFVQWLKPQKIIPTVNVGNWKSRNQMEKYFRDWKTEVPGWN